MRCAFAEYGLVAVAAGYAHSLGLKTDGSIAWWDGASTVNATFLRPTPVSCGHCGHYHSVGPEG